MRLVRPLAIVLTAASLAVGASSCGGEKSYSGTKPSTWATSVCGALTTWRDSLKSGSQSLNADLGKVRDLDAVKARFIVFLRNAERSSKTMSAEVKSAGKPAVKDGAAIQHDLETGLTRARASFDRAIENAQKLPTTNPRAFQSAVAALGRQVQKELRSTGQFFTKLGEKYDTNALNDAASKEPACKSIMASA